jgi:hypothetical protein
MTMLLILIDSFKMIKDKIRIRRILNYNENKKRDNDINMGLGACDIRCIRVKMFPGSYITKVK